MSDFFSNTRPKHEGRLVSGLFTVANPNSAKSVEIGKTEALL